MANKKRVPVVCAAVAAVLVTGCPFGLPVVSDRWCRGDCPPGVSIIVLGGGLRAVGPTYPRLAQLTPVFLGSPSLGNWSDGQLWLACEWDGETVAYENAVISYRLESREVTYVWRHGGEEIQGCYFDVKTGSLYYITDEIPKTEWRLYRHTIGSTTSERITTIPARLSEHINGRELARLGPLIHQRYLIVNVSALDAITADIYVLDTVRGEATVIASGRSPAVLRDHLYYVRDQRIRRRAFDKDGNFGSEEGWLFDERVQFIDANSSQSLFLIGRERGTVGAEWAQVTLYKMEDDRRRRRLGKFAVANPADAVAGMICIADVGAEPGRVDPDR